VVGEIILGVVVVRNVVVAVFEIIGVIVAVVFGSRTVVVGLIVLGFGVVL